MFVSSANADEGMWLPLLLNKMNYAEMQKMGLKLTPEQLYSINNSSLKDAIVMLDGGSCSAEVVSPEGLLFTNHHCGYDNIQEHSSVEHDYLTDGFWAMSREEELSNPGKTASFLIRIEDVTAKVLDEISNEISEKERTEKIHEIISKIEKEATEETHYNARVSTMFGGNEYYLYVYETFRDVRLVGAPPSSIGDYGGDTDNWMWPRHTGDFTIFRIYCAPDGKPADYSEKNIPYKPKHFLPISLKGVKKDDFAMVWGNPGNTDRYLSSFGVEYALNYFNPAIIKICNKLLEIMKEDMDADKKVRIQYASKYAGIANVWKLYLGQSKSLKKLDVYNSKAILENNFTNWVNADEARKKEYGSVIDDISEYYKISSDKKYNIATLCFRLIYIFGAEILDFANQSNDLISALKSGENINEAVEKYKEIANKYFKDYNLPTEKKKFTELLKIYSEGVPSDLQADIISEIKTKYKGNFEKYIEYLYSKSIFSTPEKLNSFLDKPNLKTIEKDPALKAATSFFNSVANIENLSEKENGKIRRASRLFIKGLREMMPNKKFYPNANSTMRCSYGTIVDYYPADAVYYDWHTYMKGIIEKEDPENEDFIVPEKLKEIYLKKDFGRYGEGDKMPLCFLTNNDITGGSSGSSVINANGELIGIAFDSNWEGVGGDIIFDPDMQRCVNVDIRYVLLIIDKYAGATHLIDEMTLINNKPVVKPDTEEQKEIITQ
ncbi:MAG: S46 family peptidase [Bacteroidales bacterium]|nr:S46 family peptidase [Bacteroidales bacterium]